ncbi:MAG: TonB-dependent receptor [Chloracidobacterium sp.]|nr:TonB-dependent receptor [Chloracidobacterium sp.]
MVKQKITSTAMSAVVALLLLSAAAFAQRTTADIVGNVIDSAGNPVAGATVTATNVGTAAARSITTNSSGAFRIVNLPPGLYDVTAEAPNFSRSVVKALELNVGSDLSINVEIKPGQITEVVEVTAEGALIQTTRSEIDTGISPKEIENLPLLNRTFAGLSLIAPEARPVGNFDPTKTRVGNVAFNGGDGRSVNVNIDGGDNKDNVVGSLLQNFSYESIQEFQVIQHRWSADQGRAVGGVVNVITKSGTNGFHGSFFSNFRDDAITSSTYFDKLTRESNPAFEKPEFNRQEFGGSIGGPIVKDRAFFFFAMERFRERQNNAVAPSAIAEIQAIPGNQFVPEIPTPYDDTLLSAKVDHRLTDKQSMFYRFSYQGNESPNDQVAVPARTDLSGGNFNTNKLYSFVANHTYNVRPNMLNQVIFHFQDFKNEILGVTDGQTLNFPGGITIGQNANVPQATEERKFQFRDDFSWIKGDHTMKFGMNYIHTILGGYFYFGTRGYSFTFGQTPTAIMAGGGFEQPGLLTALTYSDGASSHDQVIDQLAFYVQDDWKINRKLTLNLGLRWDANIGNLPAQDQNRTILILSQLNDPRARAITGDAEKLRKTTPSWTEFQPRIGFAYDPFGDGKTVIRGGYGIFYDQIFQNLSLFSQVQSEPEIFQTAISLTAAQLSTYRFGVDPLPSLPPGFNFGNLAVGAFGRINDPDAKEPYVQKFSIGFQRELSDSVSLSSDYVHTLGLQEPRFLNINPQVQEECNPLYPGVPAVPDPAVCPRGASTRYFDAAFLAAGLPANRLEQINMFTTNNRSLFDSWTTTIKWRASKFLLNASYILASNRSWGGQPVASYSGNGIAITPERQFLPEEFGPTRLDERHRIVVSGVFTLPWDFQLSPILQFATARPYSPTTGVDIDGDGATTIDRLCAGVNPLDVFNAVRNRPLVPGSTPGSLVLQAASVPVLAMNPRGCTQAPVNSYRIGYIVDSQGNIIGEGNGRFFNVDLKASKVFRFGERFALSAYADLYNIFNTENLAFSQRLAISAATTAGNTARSAQAGLPNGIAQASPNFIVPFSLFGPGFGPPVGRPFTAQFGFRFTF